MNIQIKMTSQTRHWKQQIHETFREKKSENVIVLYHDAIKPTLARDKCRGLAQAKD